MSADEVRQFEAQPQFRDAIRVRLWDDRGKVAGLSTQPLAHYYPMIEEFALDKQGVTAG
jgi:predicted HD phosphohydrolase